MGWLILILVIAFLIASALPLIRESMAEKRRREAGIGRDDTLVGSANSEEDEGSHS